MPNKTTDTITVTKNDVIEEKGVLAHPKIKKVINMIIWYLSGVFQPFHLGHKSVVDEALKLAENVIMLIGSANLPIYSHSFSVEARSQMILGAFDKKMPNE